MKKYHGDHLIQMYTINLIIKITTMYYTRCFTYPYIYLFNNLIIATILHKYIINFQIKILQKSIVARLKKNITVWTRAHNRFLIEFQNTVFPAILNFQQISHFVSNEIEFQKQRTRAKIRWHTQCTNKITAVWGKPFSHTRY